MAEGQSLYDRARQHIVRIQPSLSGENIEALNDLGRIISQLEQNEKEARFNNFCPYDYRYRDKKLGEYLFESSTIRYFVKVQAALMKGLHKFGKATEKNVVEMEEAVEKVSPALVQHIEDNKTRHDQLAVIHALKDIVSEDTARRIHPGTTSYDIIDTARNLAYKEATTEYIIPRAKKLLGVLVDLAEEYVQRPQIGRTHGQWTSPVIFGYTIIIYANRIADRIQKAEIAANALEGKVAGITGTHASICQIVGEENALDFEKYVIKDVLGLEVCPAATQIIPREKLTDLTHYLISLDTVLADLSNSMRHLQRSEIHEVGERSQAKMGGEEELGGSSADPSKSNPINFENVNGLWRVILTAQAQMYHQSVSDHQRDLTNSVMLRFEPTHTICGVNESVGRLTKVMGKLAVYADSMDENLEKAQKFSIAEALTATLKGYYLDDAFLGMDPHEKVRALAKEAKKQDKPLLDIALKDDGVKYYWDHHFSDEQKSFLKDIKLYTSLARQKTLALIEEIREKFGWEE